MDPAAPILGDDQIAWAASYVAQRLDGALNDLAAASDALNEIAAEPPLVQVDEKKNFQGPPTPIKIVIDDVEVRAVSRGEIEVSRDAMKGLRSALDEWSNHLLNQPMA